MLWRHISLLCGRAVHSGGRGRGCAASQVIPRILGTRRPRRLRGHVVAGEGGGNNVDNIKEKNRTWDQNFLFTN